MRKGLGVLRTVDEIAFDLKILVRHRTERVNDRTRQINRLREQLLEICSALEQTLSLTNKGSVLLLTGYRTPAVIRRSGDKRIETWLKNRKVEGAALVARAAVEAARAQHTALPGEKLAGRALGDRVMRLSKPCGLRPEGRPASEARAGAPLRRAGDLARARGLPPRTATANYGKAVTQAWDRFTRV